MQLLTSLESQEMNQDVLALVRYEDHAGVMVQYVVGIVKRSGILFNTFDTVYDSLETMYAQFGGGVDKKYTPEPEYGARIVQLLGFVPLTIPPELFF
jgi:hypothetical protein